MRSKSVATGNTIRYVIITFLALLFAFPFLWMILGSLKTLTGYYERPVRIFFSPTWDNYVYAIKNIGLVKHTFNSIYVAGAVIVLQVVTSCLAAFAFSMLNFPGKKVLFGVVMSTMMIPLCVMMVPLFIIVQKLGFMNTYAAMILPFGFSGFGIFLLRQTFLGLPRDLFSAAEIDGAGFFRIMWLIYFPLALPGVMTLAIITFINYFNSFLWPLVSVNSDSKMVLSVRMIAMIAFDRVLEPNKILSTAAICIIPPLIVFVSLQKFFVQGYAMSGIKG